MENIFSSLFSINFWSVVKVLVMVGLLVYLIFAFVVVRQVKLMTDVVSGILGLPLRILSWLFFLFSALIFVFTLVFL